MAPKEKKPEVGIVFPETNGKRSSGEVGKLIIEGCFQGVDQGVAKEKNWRFKYNKHFKNLVKTSVEKGPEWTVASAKAGLDYFYSNFEFVPSAGAPSVPFSQHLNECKETFQTGLIKGEGKSPGALLVPFNGGYTKANQKAPADGEDLKGDALKSQLASWAESGAMEVDAAAAVSWLSDYLESGKTLSETHFVLIGAGSAMGPFGKLMELGANVIALDIPGSWGGPRPSWKVWDRLGNIAKGSSGTLTVPMTKKQSDCETWQEFCEACGANLIEQPAMVRNWVKEVVSKIPKGHKVIIGNYTYLDGDAHVKLALAADTIIAGVREVRKDTGVAFLCTPTDIHLVPKAAHDAAVANYGGGFFPFIKLMQLFGKMKENANPLGKLADGFYAIDGLSVAQGPNYALAKRMQHWRAQLTFDEGAVASTRVAPSTATISVMHNKTFQWAYFGMPYFLPFEIFKQETTNAIMGALLVHDVLNPKASKNPANRKQYGINNTLELFKTDSVHGGLWRCGYNIDSMGEACAIVHFLGGPQLFNAVMSALMIFALAAVAYFVM